MNNKLEDFLGGIKIGELIHKNEVETEKSKNCILKCCLITLAVIAVVAIAGFTAYKLITKKLDEFDDFDDDFDDDFFFEDEEDADDYTNVDLNASKSE